MILVKEAIRFGKAHLGKVRAVYVQNLVHFL